MLLSSPVYKSKRNIIICTATVYKGKSQVKHFGDSLGEYSVELLANNEYILYMNTDHSLNSQYDNYTYCTIYGPTTTKEYNEFDNKEKSIEEYVDLIQE